ncbi:MAG: PIN domain-containing protein [Bacteroidota bacterium]
MKVILDANVLVSFLISGRADLREVLLESDHEFFSPNFLFSEVFKYKERIMERSRLAEDELYELLLEILEKIDFSRTDFISLRNKQKGYDLCKDIDVKDTLYVALTLEINGRLWTDDKKLKKHLVKNGFTRFFQP